MKSRRRWSNQILQDKVYLRDHHSQIQNWSDDRWKTCLAAGGRSKRRYQYCFDNLGTIVLFRVHQGHSGSNLIDSTLQDNVLIGSGTSLTFTMWETLLIFTQLPEMDWYQVKI